MTEEQIKIEEPMQKSPEEATATVEEMPEEKAPKKGLDKKMWIVIVSIIVVIALVATAFIVLFGEAEEGLEVYTTPSSVDAAKGEEIIISVYVNYTKGSDRTDVSDDLSLVTFSWVSGSDDLGDVRKKKTDTNMTYAIFTAEEIGTSTLNCKVKYEKPDSEDPAMEKTIGIPVTVGPAVLSYVEISPPGATLLKNTSQLFEAEGFMTDGTEATGATFVWDLSGDPVGTISQTSGVNTTFNALDIAENTILRNATLGCTASLGGMSVSTSVTIEVIPILPPEEITAKFYDFFGVTFDKYWWDRAISDYVLHDGFPNVEVWLGGFGDNWAYSTAKMDVVARNVSATNTSVNPLYVPIANPGQKGGTIQIDWVGDYIDMDEVNRTGYEQVVKDWYDGWFFRWNGTVTMDKVAAKMVIGLTDADFEDFDNWKSLSAGSWYNAWSQFMASEAGKGGRVDIWPYYEYEWNPMVESYDIEMVDDKIVFHIVDHLSWGAECLISRWWVESFIQYEYWPENIVFNATLKPLWSDFDLKMDLTYTPLAENNTDGKPVWIFENMRGDALPDDANSMVNPYIASGQMYFNRQPGNAFYNTMRDYDYTPWAWNLSSDRHKYIIEWPTSDEVIGYYHKIVGGVEQLNDYSLNITGYVQPRWIEPIPSTIPAENIDLDFANNTLTFIGPINMYEWSMNTWAVEDLIENWSMYGRLPRGIPYIEFEVVSDNTPYPVPVIVGPDLVKTGNSNSWNASASWALVGNIQDYEWDFGDGSLIETDEEVNHIYTADGDYTITLTVNDSEGNSKSTTKMIKASTVIAPEIIITKPDGSLAPAGARVDDAVTLGGWKSFDLDGSITDWEWDFGDGSLPVSGTGHPQNTTHTYTTPGTYIVSLTLTDNATNIATGTKDLRIAVNLSDPIAKFVMPQMAVVNASVSLDASNSLSLVGATITSYDWDFDDGGTATGVATSHTWNTTGTHSATLTVTDDGSNVSTPVMAYIEIYSDADIGIGLSLETHALKPGESTNLTITMVDMAGNTLTTFAGVVDLSSAPSAGVTMPATATFIVADGGTKTLTGIIFANAGSYKITANYSGYEGYEFASVDNRTVEITVYDIFEYPLYSFWDDRGPSYNQDYRYEYASAPYVHYYVTNTAKPLQRELYTTYRIGLDARNIPEISINNPTFLPNFAYYSPFITEISGITGGNATYDLYWQYLASDRWEQLRTDGWVSSSSTNNDGWWCMSWSNLTMDRDAAARLMGIPLAWSQSDIEDWWDPAIGPYAGQYDVQDAWELYWWANETGTTTTPGRLDYSAMYDAIRIVDTMHDGSGAQAPYQLSVTGGGTQVVLSMFKASWGEDALLIRQMYYGGENYGDVYPDGPLMGVLPTEGWLEDFHMTVDMRPTDADVMLDTGIVYGWRAYESADAPTGTASWRWEVIEADYLISNGATILESELDPYYTPTILTYASLDCGSKAYGGEEVTYDFVPGIWIMEQGESLVIEAPDGVVIGYLPSELLGYDATHYFETLDVIEKWGYATLHASGLSSDEYTVDAASGDLKIVGPFTPPIVPHPDNPAVAMNPAPLIEIWV